MIIPIIHGVVGFFKAPVTWCLLIINAMMMSLSLSSIQVAEKAMESSSKDDFFIQTQGRLYAQFIKQNRPLYSEVLQQMAEKVGSGSEEKLDMLGTLALRNESFMNKGLDIEYSGDQVAIADWREKIVKIRQQQAVHPSFVMGLNADDLGLGKWLSYIFVHSGLWHFVGNMLCLMIFGCALEPLIGGLATLIAFLLSGMVAAGTFLLLSGATLAPLVGASGAVSGLMALCCFLLWRKPVGYLYFLLPMRGYSGIIYLPCWVSLLFWILSDLTGYLSSLSEIGGVAYTAHLGGEAAGILIGLTIYCMRYRKPWRWHSATDSRRVGEMVPFFQPMDSNIRLKKSA